ncbi:hypothetical protein IMSAGC013_04842 [Lachnospiraceae bacterium]|jgi:SOS-response transcriptional repressor LexA|nr:hypothetical protein IMSAGC013_04842 [Lachnospiraceae bacterium]
MIDWSNFENKLQERGRRAELSRQTGISTGNIRDWFNPDKPAQPSANALVKISKALDCSVDYLLGLTDVEKRATNKSNIIPIPIVKQKAAAGLGIQTNDYSECIDEYRFFDKTQIPSETEFGIIIEGDSMEPIFKNGQVVFVKKLDDCDHNDYGIFCITEDEITRIVFKRKILLKDGTYCLRSVNPDYKDIGEFSETKICRCVAKMVLKS